MTRRLTFSSSFAADLPLRKDKSYRWRIVSITRVDGGATVMVAEDACWGSVSFVDFFTVTRINRSWKITNKTFAYTGGGIPQAVKRWAPPS